MDYIDIPSDQLLPEIEKAITEQIGNVTLPENQKIVISDIKWTAEGLRVWILTGKLGDG